jgi:synaptojanin
MPSLVHSIYTTTVFWEQQGIQTFGQRIQITRPHASQPAFERHFAQLTEEYGAVHAINLLGSKENEAILTSAYDRHLQIARGGITDSLNITHFDFHNQVRIGGHDSVVRELRWAPDAASGPATDSWAYPDVWRL